MKYFILPYLLMSQIAFAQRKSAFMEITFRGNGRSHKYSFVRDKSKNSYQLSFVDGRKRESIAISPEMANYFKNEITQIAWTSQYRKPANTNVCHEYMSITENNKEISVCLENRDATGKSLSLLNSMRSLFPKN